MKCELFRPLIPADAGDLLDDGEAAELHAHLVECEGCAAERAALVNAFAAAVPETIDPPPEVWERVVAQLSGPRGESVIGERFGPCRVLAVLGRGGMGVVYRAYHEGLEREVCLRILPPGLTQSRFVDRWRARNERLASLEHPNVVQTYPPFVTDDGVHCQVTEYFDGSSLDEEIARRGKCEPAEAAVIVLAMARALRAAHAQDVLHLDLNPDTVLLGSDGQVKLVDFAARRPADAESLTRSGAIMGTPFYLSPEQCMGKPVDGRSDVYALGTVLYTLLTGARPFQGTCVSEVFLNKLKDDLRSPTELAPDLPVAYQRVLAKLLARQPENRYASAGEAIADLEALQHGLPVEASEPFPWDLARERALTETNSKRTCGLIAILGLGLLATLIACLLV